MKFPDDWSASAEQAMRMRTALLRLKEHLEYDQGATCDICEMHRSERPKPQREFDR